jgi:DNA invertase Pin-like site-specific DNA recombinase
LGQRAAIYCRVSTADQSCARQERDLTAFAARAGYEVVVTRTRLLSQRPRRCRVKRQSSPARFIARSAPG